MRCMRAQTSARYRQEKPGIPPQITQPEKNLNPKLWHLPAALAGTALVTELDVDVREMLPWVAGGVAQAALRFVMCQSHLRLRPSRSESLLELSAILVERLNLNTLTLQRIQLPNLHPKSESKPASYTRNLSYCPFSASWDPKSLGFAAEYKLAEARTAQRPVTACRPTAERSKAWSR